MLILLLAILCCAPVTEDGIQAYYLAEKKKPVEERQPPLLTFSEALEVGDIGVIPYAFDPAHPKEFVTTRIREILTDDSMLMEVQKYALVRRSIAPATPEESDVMIVLVRKVDTRGQVDGKRMRLAGGLKVVGTEKVAARTVYVMEPYKLPSLKD